MNFDIKMQVAKHDVLLLSNISKGENGPYVREQNGLKQVKYI